jgi:rifampicin phosphotransferase
MRFCVRLEPGADAAKLGGKARSLLRLAAAGLRVPEALVVTSDLFASLRAGGPALPPTPAAPGALAAIAQASRALAARPWPDGLIETLTAMLRTLAPEPDARFAVRSSASIEDGAGTLAAGLYLSRLDVPGDGVPEAVRAVLLSALGPGVIAYLAQRGLSKDALGVSVLIHRFIAGDAAGTAAVDPAAAEIPAIETQTHMGDAGAARDGLGAALSRLAAAHGAVEVEWVATGTEVTFLQLRPYQSARRTRRAVGPNLADLWRWDAAHNPLPLSPAQAGLVALVDRTCTTGFRQRVADGYLFCAEAASPQATAGTDAPTATAALGALRAIAEPRLAMSAPTLEEALENFTAIYQPLFGVVQPAARAARAALTTFLRHHGIDAGPHLPALLGAIPSAAGERTRHARAFIEAPDAAARASARAAYLETFGDESPCWDVVAPTWREAPEALERRLLAARRDVGRRTENAAFQAAVARIVDRLPPAAREDWAAHLAAARAGAAVGEDDDALYARAAAQVRHALLREGARLCASGVLENAEDVFWLPLEIVRRDAGGAAKLSRDQAGKLVRDARSANAEARANPPPISSADVLPEASDVIRGRSGAGGACIGRVRIWPGEDPAPAASADEIVVARTILPTELPLIAAAALVVETGGPLDHVAAQARERGIPAVVGAAGACLRLHDGDRVLVDGDAGLVVKLGES